MQDVLSLINRELIAIYNEDFGLYRNWVKELLYIHCDWFYRWYKAYDGRHIRVSGFEVDYYIECIPVKQKKQKKTIIVEFKNDKEWAKLLEQAIARRRLAQYFYVGMNLPVHQLLNIFLSQKYLQGLLYYGIGLISLKDDVVIVKSYWKNKSYSKYPKLFKFLEKVEEAGEEENEETD